MIDLQLPDLKQHEYRIITEFAERFAPIERRFANEKHIPEDALDREFEPRELKRAAKTMEHGLIITNEVERKAQLLRGRLIFLMDRAGLWSYTEGSPKTHHQWYQYRLEDGTFNEDFDHAYSSQTKYRRVYQRWIHNLNNPEINASIMRSRNLDVVDAYSRVITPQSAPAWAEDATKEVSPSQAARKAQAGLRIHVEQRIPLEDITPQMAEQAIQFKPKKRKMVKRMLAKKLPTGWWGNAKADQVIEVVETEVLGDDTFRQKYRISDD